MFMRNKVCDIYAWKNTLKLNFEGNYRLHFLWWIAETSYKNIILSWISRNLFSKFVHGLTQCQMLPLHPPPSPTLPSGLCVEYIKFLLAPMSKRCDKWIDLPRSGMGGVIASEEANIQLNAEHGIAWDQLLASKEACTPPIPIWDKLLIYFTTSS